MLADEQFSKAIRRLTTYVKVNKNLRGNLVSSLESQVTSDEKFKVTSVPFSIPDFILLNCELENFTFKVLY